MKQTQRLLAARRIERYQAARKPKRGGNGYAAFLEIERILDGPAPSAQDVAEAMARVNISPDLQLRLDLEGKPRG